MDLYTIVTAIGKTKIANATVYGTKVNFAKLKVGDSNGAYYEPTENQKDLVHTVWEGKVNDVVTGGEENPNWIVALTPIPPSVGGFTIREAGIFDEEGDLLAIAKYPESYKPKMEEGSTSDLTIELIFEVSNAASVTLTIDPLAQTASKKDLADLNEKIKKKIEDINTSLNDMAQDRIYYCGTTTGTNAYTVLNDKIKAYAEGLTVRVKIGTASTGASSLNINGLGAKAILDSIGNTIASGGLKAGLMYQLSYNGENFIVLGKGGGGNATAPQILKNKTATVDSGPVTGTMEERGTVNYNLPLNGIYNIQEGHYNVGKITQNIAKCSNIGSPDGSGFDQLIGGNAANDTVGRLDFRNLPRQYIEGDMTVHIKDLLPQNIVNGVRVGGVNGILGNASIESLGGVRFATGKVGIPNTGDNRGTISLGFTPNLIAMSATAQTNYNAWYNSSIIPILSGGIPYRVGVNVNSSRVVVYESNDIDVSGNMHVHPIDNGFIWRLGAQGAPKDMTWVALKI